MPTSVWRGIEAFIEIVTKTRSTSFLDIGVGNGKWGFLFREYTDVWNERCKKSDWMSQIHGIEIYEPYIQDHQRAVYDRIYHGDASVVIDSLQTYDIIMAGDVIEHLDKPVGERLVRKLMQRSRRAFIAAIPLGKEWLGSSPNENEFETHRAAWTLSDAKALGFKYYKVYDATDGRRRIGFFVYSQDDLRGVGGLEEFESSRPLRVVHMSLTPLAGSPIRIVNCLNRFSEINARLIVLDPSNSGSRTFENDLVWDRQKEASLTLIDDCDILHLHHFFDLRNNPFGIDLTTQARTGKKFVRQFHSAPGFLARRLCGGNQRAADEMVRSSIPQLVIPHCAERFYPRARVVPQVLPLDDELYMPLEPKTENPIIFYTPSVSSSAWLSEIPESRWETKGYPETRCLLERVVACVRGASLSIIQDKPHSICLAERRRGHISIDEMISGSFHLCSFESLAQGLPTFAYLDARTLQVLADLTGSSSHPWMNFKLEDSEQPLKTLLMDGDLRQQIGRYSREWMEKYWNPRDMVQHYVRAYRDLMEHPGRFNTERFDLSNRRQMWYVRDSHDITWAMRVRANRDARESTSGTPGVSLRQESSPATTEQLLLQAQRPICIVGNAKMQRPFGTIIDSYATVIRMNNFKICGFEEFVGTKTDYRCVTGWDDVENRNEHIEFSPFTAEARESSNLDLYNSHNNHEVITAAHDVKRFISEVLNPSAGFALVQLFDMLDIPVDLFGFDGFRTDHYWRNQKVETTHSTREIEYILKRRNVVLYNDCGFALESRPNEREGRGSRRIFSKIQQRYEGKQILIWGGEDSALVESLQTMGNEVTILEATVHIPAELRGIRLIQGGPLSLLWEKAAFDVFIACDPLAGFILNDCNILVRQVKRLCDEFLLAITVPAPHASDRPNLLPEWWEQNLADEYDVKSYQDPADGYHVLTGHRKQSLQPSGHENAGLPSDFCLKNGYQSRLRPDYFVDSCEEHDGIVWQPDVYNLAAELGALTGCSKIIDIGCGRGQKLVRLHPRFDIVGIDSGVNIQYCRQTYSCGRWIEWDFELPACPPIDNETLSQSAIVCSDVVEHLLDPSHLLGYIRSWLEHSPIAVLSTPERDLTRGAGDNGPPGNPAHVREWNVDEFKRLLAAANVGMTYCGLTRSNNRDYREQTIVCIAQKESSEAVAACAKKRLDEVREFEKLQRGHPKRIGLFGASSRGRQCLALLAGNDRFVPAWFFDNDPGKWGTRFENLPVLPPQTSNLESVDVVLIASMRANEIISQLAALGMSRHLALDVPDLFLRFSSPDEEPPPGKHEIASELTNAELVKLVEKDVSSESRSLADRLMKTSTAEVNADRGADVAAVTICCNNYLGMAATLARSHLLHHPRSRFYLCLVGRRASHLTYPDQLDNRIVVTEAEKIGIEDFPAMAFGYDTLELNCAVKPFFLEWVFANSDCRSVLYLDPDILVISPLEPIFEGLQQATIALTPHITAPVEDDRSPSELDFLRNGTFNLGCIGLRRGSEATRFLSWWRRRLRQVGSVDPANGQFVDQKWLDLAPSLFPDHFVVRDPGCNAAYWNLQERTIGGTSTELTANGAPLRFFHFSGFDPLNPHSLSKHQNRHALPPGGPLRLLFDAYRLLLARAGHFTYRREPYDYDRFENGVRIPRIARQLYRQLEGKRSPGNPFETHSADCFFNWLNEPIAPGSRVTRLFEAINRAGTVQRDRPGESESETKIVQRISEAAQFHGLDPVFLDQGHNSDKPRGSFNEGTPHKLSDTMLINKAPGIDATLQGLTSTDLAVWGRVWSRTWQAFQNRSAGSFQGRRGIIYGASVSGQLVYSVLKAMACEILAVVDSSPSKIGAMFIDNRPILSPDEVDWQNTTADFVLIASSSAEATRQIRERISPVCNAEVLAFYDLTVVAPPKTASSLPPLHPYPEWLRHAEALPSDLAWMRGAAARLDGQLVFDVILESTNRTQTPGVSATLESLRAQVYGKWRAFRLESENQGSEARILLATGPEIDAGIVNTTMWSFKLDAGAQLAPDALFELAVEALMAPAARSIAFNADRQVAEGLPGRRFDPRDRVVAVRTDPDGSLDASSGQVGAAAQPDRVISKVLITQPGICTEASAAGESTITLTPILNKAPLRFIDRESIRHILLVKLDHIGDAVLNIPVIRRVREWFPKTDITLLAATWNEQLLREQLQPEGTVQRVLTFDFFHEVSGGGLLSLEPSQIKQLGDRLEPFHFDLAIDLRREGDTREVLRAIPARWKIAYGAEDPFSLLGLNPVFGRPGQDGPMTITRQMHLLLDAYLRPDDSLLSNVVLHPVAGNGDHSEGEAAQWTIGFSPGCGDQLRIWPARHYAETADLLSERLNARTFWFGTTREEPLVSSILRAMKYGDRAVSFAGRLDLPGFAHTVRQCQLFIGNTTGPTHIAAGSGIPTLNIFSGQVSPFEWAPIGPAPFVLRVKTACAPCHRLGGTCEFGARCLTAITPQAAARASCQILLGIHGSIDSPPRRGPEARDRL